MRNLRALLALVLFSFWSNASGQAVQKVVDVPTRPGVTQRILLLTPPEPKATVVLFPGGHGGLQIFTNGSMKWGEGNFLVRTRQLFAEAGLAVAIVDAPSDRQSPPYLQGFRQRPDHVADIKAVISSLRESVKAPVWLVGTSRGTQSVAFLATELLGTDGPDGIVLTATILKDDKGRAVPAMPLNKIRVPVLVVHHEQDGCEHCSFSLAPELMGKLGSSPKSQLLAFKGGDNKGDPCEAMAHHGFNGIEREVVSQTVAWIIAK
jgi:hypothetical protein